MSQPEITLYTLGGAFGVRSISPFCLKMEMLLAHLGFPYTLIEEPDPRKAPKGKMPYAIINGETIADSELIMNKLDELSEGRVFGQMDPRQRAQGVAYTRLAEEHLYWIMVASRWLDDDWFPHVVNGFFHIAPALVRPLVANMAQRQVRKTYHLQGLGRHSHDEQVAFARADLQALQDAVSDQAFLFGDEPCIYDFTIAALLSGLYDNQPPTWMTQLAMDYPELRAYADRVQEHIGVYGRK